MRRVSSVSEITGMESGVPLLQEIFRLDRSGAARHANWSFEATGIVPRFVENLRVQGIEVPLHLFHPREA